MVIHGIIFATPFLDIRISTCFLYLPYMAKYLTLKPTLAQKLAQKPNTHKKIGFECIALYKECNRKPKMPTKNIDIFLCTVKFPLKWHH